MFLKFDRNVNPYEFAYAKAKEQKEVEVPNEETYELEKKVVDGLFTGWDDWYFE